MPERETRPCPKCDGIQYHNRGISRKSNKPYENWKCSSCEEIEWIDQWPKEKKDAELENLAGRVAVLEIFKNKAEGVINNQQLTINKLIEKVDALEKSQEREF